MKSADVIEVLRERHIAELFFVEVRAGAGYGGVSQRRIDAWALHPHPSRSNCRTSYEIKVSRGDFLKELKDPRKRKAGLLFSNEFYFAAPKGIIRVGEVPPEAGLIEIVDNVRGSEVYNWNVVVAAPWRDTPPPSWRFVASLLRNALKVRPPC